MAIIKAKVGENLKITFLVRPVYAGMLNKTTFSIAMQNLGNLYFPTTTDSITIFGKKFRVVKIDESEIQLEEIPEVRV